MKISSWNVNSVRARLINIINYLKYSNPDILMIQEIKTEEKNFPFNDFKRLGYESYVFGQKSYNGVAFVTKINIENVNLQFINDKNKQSRVITGDIKKGNKVIKLINVYVPNGNPIGTPHWMSQRQFPTENPTEIPTEVTRGNLQSEFLMQVPMEIPIEIPLEIQLDTPNGATSFADLVR